VRVTNELGIGLPLAVWLLTDNYDYVDKPNYFSVTTLQKPLRQRLLPQRIPVAERTSDVADYISRALGHSIHDSMEQPWLTGGFKRAMRLLGIPDKMIECVRVNPSDDELVARKATGQDTIPVYTEQRLFRELVIDGVTYVIGGKFDLCAEGILQDTKSTSAWAWARGTRDDDHIEQMSAYRWLDAGQDGLRKITEDYGIINYVFTDWSKAMLRTPNYPQKRVESKPLQLRSLDQTEAWITSRIRETVKHANTPEPQLPECTDEELWRSAPQYKYFADPSKASDPNARSTKNFDDLVEARRFMAEKGGKGTIITKPGEVKACAYCAGFDACTQKDRYL
jgi:hypothetical protein